MPSPKPVRVFIIDDNELARTVLRMIFRTHGFEIVGEAKSDRDILEQLELNAPDVVCLDILMETCNGLDVLKRIKAAIPDLPVFMITGSNDLQTVQKAIDRGADGFIIKPIRAGTVIDMIEKRLAQRPSLPPSMDMDSALDL